MVIIRITKDTVPTETPKMQAIMFLSKVSKVSLIKNATSNSFSPKKTIVFPMTLKISIIKFMPLL